MYERSLYGVVGVTVPAGLSLFSLDHSIFLSFSFLLCVNVIPPFVALQAGTKYIGYFR
jgi:hypothetical protein